MHHHHTHEYPAHPCSAGHVGFSPYGPTTRIKGAKSSSLKDKTIVLGVTGSIAAVRAVELARELIRNGADVYAVMTEAAQGIITPDAMEYATGHQAITKIGGMVEHVGFMGADGIADMLLIAPCTANTIGKIAVGIDDTPLTTFATTAMGAGKPVMIVPAMHESMYNHPAVIKNIELLRKYGVIFVGPHISEMKAKIAGTCEIVLNAERILSSGRLVGKRVIITSGPTIEPIDLIRVLTNRSSGRTGRELALEAYRQGADVTVMHNDSLGIRGIGEVTIESASDMTDAVLKAIESEGCDLLICSAAIADYTVEKESGKIKSDRKGMTLSLKPTRKLLNEVRKRYPDLRTVGFKAEAGVGRDELISSARELMERLNLDIVVANDVGEGGIGTETNNVTLIRKGSDRELVISGSKRQIARIVIESASEVLR